MTFIEEIKNILPSDRYSTNQTVLENHGKDESFHQPALPDIVVFPTSAEEVSSIMKIAYKYETPVIPFGVGSSVEGHIIPQSGGISIDFSLLNKVLEVRESDFLVVVQPGVTRLQLNKELKKYGLFFPVDPGADATIGGMTATNASGTTSVKYGIMRDQVKDIEVVLSDGRIIHTGNLAPKSSSGIHLNGLFVGSEGTLGCFTEITLKVYGIPEYKMTGRATFETIESAVESVVMIQAAGLNPARCEFVDARSVKQVNDYNGMNYPEKPTLFFEFYGNEAGLKQDLTFAHELLEDRSIDITFETDSKASHELWEVRHQLLFAFLHSYPGKNYMATDVCVPVSELAGAITFARETIDSVGIDGGIFGHVGDGNFHSVLMIDSKNPEDLKKANIINEKIVKYALGKRGTCTGEHGVGIGKKKYQADEFGEALEVMKSIKALFDPKGIMNPGKIF